MTRDEIIAEELATDPLTRGYAGMSDDAARDDMNTEYRTIAQGVWLSDLYQYLSHRNCDPGSGFDIWPCLVMLKEARESGTVQGQAIAEDERTAAINLDMFFDHVSDIGGQSIYQDFSQAAIRLSWDAMVSVGVITQTQRDTIPTLSDIPQSRGNELGVGRITTADISRNRP